MPVTLKNVECDKKSVVHSLPCSIHADAKADVNKFFKPSGDDDNMTGSLRGYPLNGKTVALPSGYTGLIVETTESSDNEPTTVYTCQSKFDALNYWNWDQVPSRNDKFLASLDWLDVAKTIHECSEDTA